MSKVYKGHELIKAIADGEIKNGSRFRINGYKGIIEYKYGTLYYVDDAFDEISSSVIIGCIFELIEEDTIDIDSIEELTGTIDIRCNNKNIEVEDYFYNTTNIVKSIKSISDKHNELVQAVKQLNKEIKELNKKYCCNCGVELTEENKALPNMCNNCKYGEE